MIIVAYFAHFFKGMWPIGSDLPLSEKFTDNWTKHFERNFNAPSAFFCNFFLLSICLFAKTTSSNTILIVPTSPHHCCENEIVDRNDEHQSSESAPAAIILTSADKIPILTSTHRRYCNSHHNRHHHHNHHLNHHNHHHRNVWSHPHGFFQILRGTRLCGALCLAGRHHQVANLQVCIWPI